MGLADLLGIQRGVTAVIGGGGKTTLLRTLGEELAKEYSVLLCTTTKILPFPGLPCAENEEDLHRLRHMQRLICAGRLLPDSDKLTDLGIPFAQLAGWFDYVLVETDGAAGRPMKAHAPHEPVIPAEADQIICVVGASGFGHPIADVVHRPELFARLTGTDVQTVVTPKLEATVLNAEALHRRVYINQVESESSFMDAKTLAEWLDCPVLAGSLQKGEYFQCSL